jgi:transmembrane sensor
VKKEELIEDLLSSLSVPENKSQDQIWLELNSKLERTDNTIQLKRRSVLAKFLPYAAAACVVCAVFFLYPSGNFTSFVNDSSSVSYHILPDGSAVSLSPNSKMEFGSDADSRDVNLNGEAFFEVKKGVPFTVNTANGNVSVLGTSFYVTSRNELLDVKCFTGKVKVNSNNAEVFLLRGEGMSSVSETKYMHSSLKKWEKGDLSFDNVPLNIVLEDLMLFKGMSIVNTSGFNPSITLELDEETEEEIINIICTISNLNFKVVGDSDFQLYK